MGSKYTFLIVGASGSGKTTLANNLCKKLGWKQVESYTTRPPRYDGEKGHTFISDDEFDQLVDFVGYTEYNGYRYAATTQQAEECDIYVIDPAGVEFFYDNYRGAKPFYVIYIDTPEMIRYDRMVERGDSPELAKQRIVNDRKVFGFAQIYGWCTKYVSFIIDGGTSPEGIIGGFISYCDAVEN